jgi:hypothetical protein
LVESRNGWNSGAIRGMTSVFTLSRKELNHRAKKLANFFC